ncbi:oxysterol-binding protein-related protein 1C isoform X4 [Lathyrus oleraceus]|uniref:oxysterol-binding protein-related protein 1C isoform X4 n=1 Tax=Pisum sativum TaxID=3888 RepID=UPI0021D2DC57|nr:oxysterol-binding protein-related protein 1C-like isoform X4 [Pisum sativum]
MPPLPSSILARSELFSRPASHIVNHSISSGGDCSRGSQRHEQNQLAVIPTAIDVRINDLVGNGISGILQKWVNYGKGWRPRWFVLQDGVLSYYKIHGPDKIVINPETEKGFKVIGDESMRIISRNKNSQYSQHWRKPFGEIHLQTEKVDLENTVVDESQRKRQGNDQEASSILGQEKFSASACGSEDDNERNDAAEEETDDDDDDATFFDTRDFVSSSSSFKSNGSDLKASSFSSDDEGLSAIEFEEDTDPSIRSVGTNYPRVKRRKKLPEPVEKEKGVSLWSLIKDNIGKDLTKVCLPVYFNEPLSSLQKCCEEMEYSYLLDRAYEWGRRGNTLLRILNVAAFAVSAYASTDGRICKPFNPLLGETYEADFPDKGFRFVSEKVSHHPTIVACHCEGMGWKFWADSNLKSKFWGRSIQLDPVGILTLEFDDGEVFQWSKVTTSIYNLILGKLYCDHYGSMRIQGNGAYSCKLKFKEQSIIDRNPRQVQGVVQDRNGKTLATLIGKWDDSMYYVNGDYGGKGKGYESLPEAHLLWKRSKPPKFPTRYNLTRFAITLNELTPGLKEKLPPTDSRLRPDQRYLENGEYEMANSEKLRLEQRQRQAGKMQASGWEPQWFAKDKSSGTYRYAGGYWEARQQRNWNSCPNIFGQIPSDHLLDQG